jgi:hypothetical protein
MRGLIQPWLLVAVGLIPMSAAAADVPAGPATDVSVTVYRSPNRPAGSLDLNQLRGFALVSETRPVSVPAGESRIRFEGVADGIQSASAIITGLPAEVAEKNRDASVLSPSALVAAMLGRTVLLVRTDPKTGRVSRITGTIRSDADGGVVFESAQGIEALRCSGLPETFSFSSSTDLAATPTLSTLIRSSEPLTATVTLSYLAQGFDWSADYVASVSPDGKTMDIGAWVTLANGNAVTFPSAHTQVIAGRLNRESGDVEAFDHGHPILAQCWPRGTTSDAPQVPIIERATPLGAPYYLMQELSATAARAAMSPAPSPAQLVQEEQLGDLKLYRVPERTTVTSRQLKQVRLLDRRAVPVELFYSGELQANQNIRAAPAHKMLRTKNDTAHHLGLPLPSGRVDSFVTRGDATLLLGEAPLRDVAVSEEFEIVVGDSPDVQVSQLRVETKISPAREQLPLLPGVLRLKSAVVDDVARVEISNAGGSAIPFELRLRLADGAQLIGADHVTAVRNGRPIFKLTIAAGARVAIRYQTEHTSLRPTLR